MQWKPEYSVGVEAIDSQHKDLFQIFDDLEQARREEEDISRVIQILYELMSFATQHFDDEEKLMQQTQYPDFLAHANQHFEFKETILNFCQQAVEQCEHSMLDDLMTFLRTWFQTHLLKSDRAYVEHFIEHGIASRD